MGKKAKETVKLRFKTLKNGEKSAYFDIYRNGVREYLWQDGRLIPETDENAKKLIDKGVNMVIMGNDFGCYNTALHQIRDETLKKFQ